MNNYSALAAGKCDFVISALPIFGLAYKNIFIFILYQYLTFVLKFNRKMVKNTPKFLFIS